MIVMALGVVDLANNVPAVAYPENSLVESQAQVRVHAWE